MILDENETPISNKALPKEKNQIFILKKSV